MKAGHCGGRSCIRSAVLLSVLLLSACTTAPRVGEATDAQPARRESAAPQPAAQPAAPQKPAPVEAQQPAPSGQSDASPKKPKHNVEED